MKTKEVRLKLHKIDDINEELKELEGMIVPMKRSKQEQIDELRQRIETIEDQLSDQRNAKLAELEAENKFLKKQEEQRIHLLQCIAAEQRKRS